MIHHTDKHLNIFHPYGEAAYLENNITKAFINTLEALTESKQYSAIYELFGLDLSNIPEQDIKFYYYLQQKPNHPIDRFPEQNRLLVAISPTGKAWKTDYLQAMSNSEKISDESIKNIAEKITIDDIDDELIKKSKEDEIQAIKNILNGRGNSIPDAWILIYQKNEPYYAIIIENKLYDLNPFQLLNHKQKSLNLPLTEFTDLAKDRSITFIKYEDIYKCLHKNYKTNFVVKHFLEFFNFAGYGVLTPFTQEDFNTFKEHIHNKDKRQSAIIRNKLIRNIIKEINNVLPKQNFTFDDRKMQVWSELSHKFNIYIDISKEETLNINISTEIGVSNYYVNKALLPKLKNNFALQDEVTQTYSSNAYYDRYIRLNQINTSLYLWVKTCATLKEYLDTINTDEIYINEVKKEECIKFLSELGIAEVHVNMERLRKYKYSKYNKLEYLRIINTINVEEQLKNGKDLMVTIRSIMQNHLAGIGVLEDIYSSPVTE